MLSWDDFNQEDTTVAEVASVLDRTLERVEAAGARVIRQEPHWFVHPKDASGVLVQLTPRLEH